MLHCVFFDLMDTVLTDPYREALRAATGLSLEALRDVRDQSAWHDFETASISEEEFSRRFFVDDRTLDIATFHRVRRAGYRWEPGMRELVEALDGAVQRHVASNYPEWIDELRVRFGLDQRFDGVWASCHLGVRKPDVRFFERLIDKAGGSDPSDCLFVDDQPRNCAAAERFGLRAHLFDGVQGLRARLAAEGVALR